ACDDRSRLQHIAAACSLERIARVLLDKEHAPAGGVDCLDRPEDVLHDHRCQTEGGLVETDEVWLGHDRAPECKHPLLAAEKRAGILTLALAQPRKHVEDLLQEASHLRRLLAVLERAELEIFAHREEREHPPAFRDERDSEAGALMRRQVRDVMPAE